MKKIFANLKMNMNYERTIDYIVKLPKDDNLIICPSYLFIPLFNGHKLGSQDVSIYSLGSHTGDIGIEQLKPFIDYAIIGHSEIRQNHNETNDNISRKLNLLIANNVCPILCVGEKEDENKDKVLIEQLSVLNGLKSNIYIAYEPVWAIGTGKIPTNEQISITSEYIKKLVLEKYNLDVFVLYGGSVDENNIEALNSIENIEGFLVGKASCNIEKLDKMLSIINSTK